MVLQSSSRCGTKSGTNLSAACTLRNRKALLLPFIAHKSKWARAKRPAFDSQQGQEFFFLLPRLDQSWMSPRLRTSGTRSKRGPNHLVPRLECVEFYLHSLILLRGVVLKYWGRFTFHIRKTCVFILCCSNCSTSLLSSLWAEETRNVHKISVVAM